MFNRNKAEDMLYGIVGLGGFGYALATELAKSGCELIVIDEDEEKIREIRELTENAYVVNNLDKKTLLETGIQNCDAAIVCIGEHIDTSILTTLNLVNMQIPKVIAKATSADQGTVLEKLGAEVVYPERDMAIRLARRLETSRILDLVQLSEKITVMKMQIPPKMMGKSIVEVNLRMHFDLNIIAIENQGRVMDIIDPQYVFRDGDIVYVSGCKAGMEKFGNWTGSVL